MIELAGFLVGDAGLAWSISAVPDFELPSPWKRDKSGDLTDASEFDLESGTGFVTDSNCANTASVASSSCFADFVSQPNTSIRTKIANQGTP
jgi:hypothetical protein